MKNIVKVVIRLFVIYSILLLLNGVQSTIGSFINMITRNPSFNDYSGLISQVIPYAAIWIIYSLVLVILWQKADALSSKIIGERQENELQDTVDKEELLEVGIILLGFFILINTIPLFFKSLTFIFLSYTYMADQTFSRSSNLRQIVEILFQLIKVLLAYELVSNRKKVIKILYK